MKIGMLFPGYTTQFVGMGKELYDNSRIIQEYFEEASNCLNINFVNLCFASSNAELAKISNAYLSLFLINSAIFAAIKNEGINIDIVAGQNVGEFAAIAAAKGFSFPDGLYIINKYAQFYSEHINGLSVKSLNVKGLNSKILKKLFAESSDDSYITISAINSPDEHIITGHLEFIDEIKNDLKSLGATYVKEYPIEAGLYCDLVQDIIPLIVMYLVKIDFKDLDTNFVSAVDGKIINSSEDVKKRFVKHSVSKIYFDKVMRHYADCDIILVPTPGDELAQLAKQYYPDKKIIIISKPEDIVALKEHLLKNNSESESQEICNGTDSTESV